MKRTILLLVLFGLTCTSYGQTRAEWLAQKKTAIKYLVAQVAALKSYGSQLSKGYTAVRQGLSAISKNKAADYDLHQAHFSSLVNASTSVQSHWKVAGIVAIEAKLVSAIHQQRNVAFGSSDLNESEKEYVNSVFNKLLQDGGALLTEVGRIIYSQDLLAEEDQRIKRIDALYEAAQEQFTFLRHFESEGSMLRLQRLREKHSVRSMQSLYKIH